MSAQRKAATGKFPEVNKYSDRNNNLIDLYFYEIAQYDAFCRSMQNTRNYDIVLKRISDILTRETIKDFGQTLWKTQARMPPETKVDLTP